MQKSTSEPMKPSARRAAPPLSRVWRGLSFRGRVVLVVSILFLLLVGLRIHGSSIALAASTWAPNEAMEHFVASPLLSRLRPGTRERWRSRLMAEPRVIRYDEWANEGTPYSLAQFSHVPAFPVVNTNVGTGQNMLVLPWAPVLHISALARPATWGYLLFGPEHGLAWCWWFQVLGCFVALYLLFELLVPHRPWLALLGAGWFCGSAYVVCWSLWPAYVTGLGVSVLVGAYWLLRSTRPAVIIGCGALVGVAFAAFCMQLYPPWQVPLGHTFVLLFAALVWRDRLWRAVHTQARLKLYGLGLALAGAAVLLGSFLISSGDALRAMAQSDYPGERLALGGDCPGWRLLGGFFNIFTKDFDASYNPSESSGFFLLSPALIVAAAVSPRIRSRLGPVVWLLLPWTGLLVYFCVAPIPEWLAAVTLLGHAPGYRAQLALGLISVILSLRLLVAAERLPLGRQAFRTALLVLTLCGGLYLWQGLEWQANVGYFTGRLPVWFYVICLVAALLSALLVLGRARIFAALLVPAVVVTSADFNPLSAGFPDWRSSELSTAIQRVLAQDGTPSERRPLWLTYGKRYFGGTVAHLMGARALGGISYYPQLGLWQTLDEDGSERWKYNRFAGTTFEPLPQGSSKVEFQVPSVNMLTVFVSPLNQKLWDMGVRHVLTFGNVEAITAPPFKLSYHSLEQNFAIWDLPPPSPRKERKSKKRTQL